MRLVLFGLTGYTNEFLPAIQADSRVELCAVFTRQYETPYPYYSIPQIHEVCAGLGVRCHTNLRVNAGPGLALVRDYQPDLILMTGFDQILKSAVLEIPRLGAINMHPALLPSFRGADPIQAALLEEAAVTGVTFHYAVPEIDAGNILTRAEYSISPDETNASLRHQLARLGAAHFSEVINLFDGGTRPVGEPQQGDPTFAHRRFAAPVSLDQSLGLSELHRIIRAVVPHPGARVCIDGVVHAVDSSVLNRETSGISAEDPLPDTKSQLVWEKDGAQLVLKISSIVS